MCSHIAGWIDRPLTVAWTMDMGSSDAKQQSRLAGGSAWGLAYVRYLKDCGAEVVPIKSMSGIGASYRVTDFTLKA